MATDRPPCVVRFVHTLPHARDWQDRPELTQLCNWWRARGNGVLALVGIAGAGKTAIADRFIHTLPTLTDADAHVVQDETLQVPEGLFVFSFDDAANPESFFDTLYDWLVTDFQLADRRRVTDSGIRLQASASLVIDALGYMRRKLLLVLDGLERLQDDGLRSGVVGHLEHSGLRSFLLCTAAGRLPGLAVLVTAGFVIGDLAYAQERGTTPQFTSVSVDEISDMACIALLRRRGVHGSDNTLGHIGRSCGRHALTLDLLASYLVCVHDGDSSASLDLFSSGALHDSAAHQPDQRLRHAAEQAAWLRHIAQSYQAVLCRGEPAVSAVLQRLCVFRRGTDAATLTSIFSGSEKEGASGPALAILSSDEVQASLDLLVDRRLIERRTLRTIPGTEYLQASVRHAPSALYTVHPAVRAGFLSGLDRVVAQHSHEAARTALLASLGEQAGMYPSAPVMLDLLEEIVYHTLRAAHVADAWDIYCHRIGGYWNLGWRLGAYERGERICRTFANGLSAPTALGDNAVSLPFRELSADWQAEFLNEWALYLKERGSLDAAACCFNAANEPDYQQGHWTNASTGSQNLAAVWLVSGRLTAGLRAATEALGSAGRADDATERMDSYAYRGHAYALQGQTDSALADFRNSLHWQHQTADQSDLPLYGLRGVFYALLHARLGHQAEAMRSTEANKEMLLRHGGPQDADIQKCHLVLAGLACEQGEFRMAHDYWRQAHAWALERDAREVLCWCALVQARIELSQALEVMQSDRDHAALQRADDDIDACRQALTDGLRMARECGFGIYHIDLLLIRAQVALISGDTYGALADIEIALLTGQHPLPDSGQPTLLAATDPECRYAWGEAEARHLRAEALLLQAVQQLGRTNFPSANSDQLPTQVRQSIADAREELIRCRNLRQRIRDPKGWRTEEVLQSVPIS